MNSVKEKGSREWAFFPPPQPCGGGILWGAVESLSFGSTPMVLGGWGLFVLAAALVAIALLIRALGPARGGLAGLLLIAAVGSGWWLLAGSGLLRPGGPPNPPMPCHLHRVCHLPPLAVRFLAPHLPPDHDPRRHAGVRQGTTSRMSFTTIRVRTR
jgi:hypothetical protein